MKLSDIITPEKFRQLATYITICDEKLGLTETGTEVQDDLRKFADALEEMEAKNISSNPVLADSLPLSGTEVRCDHCDKIKCDDDTTT